jgi:hypothetical protein
MQHVRTAQVAIVTLLKAISDPRVTAQVIQQAKQSLNNAIQAVQQAILRAQNIVSQVGDLTKCSAAEKRKVLIEQSRIQQLTNHLDYLLHQQKAILEIEQEIQHIFRNKLHSHNLTALLEKFQFDAVATLNALRQAAHAVIKEKRLIGGNFQDDVTIRNVTVTIRFFLNDSDKSVKITSAFSR